ncbi:MAG: phosphatase PAP2 family protein [Anaerolinea sp.]|nr:phosphatase PAP2 family protein [Anaerolinea sp.]
MIDALRRLLNRLPLVEHLSIQLVVGLAISLVCLGIFGALADEVGEQETMVEIDVALANALHAEATPLSTDIFILISWIGMPGLWLLGVGVGLLFLLRREFLHLAIWVAALAGGTLLNTLLKLIFARPRPVFVEPLVIEQNFSFPSGHAMQSLIAFGLFAYFLWHSVQNRSARILIVFAAVLLIVLIGISRMTLGVHYLSDVIAGFAAGGLWLAACITALDTLERRRQRGDLQAQQGDDTSPAV